MIDAQTKMKAGRDSDSLKSHRMPPIAPMTALNRMRLTTYAMDDHVEHEECGCKACYAGYQPSYAALLEYSLAHKLNMPLTHGNRNAQ